MERKEGGDRWLTRSQVAALLGIADAQIEAMHGEDLHPWQEKDRRWRYRAEEVARLLRVERGGDTAGDGKLAARAFTMFGEGKSMADVVVATEQPPGIVRRLFGEFLEMTGGLVLSAENLRTLREMLGAEFAMSGDALTTAVAQEVKRQYVKGRADGTADAEDFGEVIDFTTGERKRVPPER